MKKEKKFSCKRVLLISMILVLIFSLTAVCCSCGKDDAQVAGQPVNTQPELPPEPDDLLKDGLGNSADSLTDTGILGVAKDALKGGSFEIYCDLSNLSGLSIDGIVSLKLFTDAAKAALTAGVTVGDETLIDASAFIDEENIAVASDVLLDGKAYGIDLSDFLDDFNDSAFGPSGDYSLGFEVPEEMASALTDYNAFLEDTQDIMEDACDRMLDIVDDCAGFTMTDSTVDFNGTAIDVHAITIEADSAVCAAIVTDCVEYLRTNEDLKTFLYDNADYIVTLLSESGVIYGYYDTATEAIDEFYAELDGLTDEDFQTMTENLEEMAIDLSATVYISKSGKEFIGLDLDMTADGEVVTVDVLAGPSWDNLNQITVSVNDGYDAYDITFNVSANNDAEYAATLNVTNDGEALVSGFINWDKANGNFKAELTDDYGNTYGLTGTLQLTSKTATFTLDTVYEDSYVENIGITFVIKSSDAMPQMPLYTDILKMPSEEIETLLTQVEAIIEGLGSTFY